MALIHKAANFCVAHPKKQQSALNLEENDCVGSTERQYSDFYNSIFLWECPV